MLYGMLYIHDVKDLVVCKCQGHSKVKCSKLGGNKLTEV